jgi:ComF family protein
MEDPLDAVVHGFKYGGRPDLARPLGRILAAGAKPDPGLLVLPVPLHRRRLRERGYNQAALLARAAAASWGAPAVDTVLVRTVATPPQARLPETRRHANVSGAFAVPEPGVVRGRAFVLVDDVVTTGSTLVEASRSLYAGGASRVMPVALALA